MSKKKILTAVVGVAVIALLVALGFCVRIRPAVDAVAVLKTTGMTCSSCSNTITGALNRLKGVAVTEVDVEGGWVLVGYEKKTVKPEQLTTTVREAGFASTVHMLLTPEQFKQITGRDMGKKVTSKGCCGKDGGCGQNRQK